MDLICLARLAGLAGIRLRRSLPVLLVVLVLPLVAGNAFADSLEVTKIGLAGTDPGSQLVIEHSLSCKGGSALTNPELQWFFTAPSSLVGTGPITKSVASPTGSTVLLDATDLQAICAALPPGTTTIRGLVVAVGVCDGKLVKGCSGIGVGSYGVKLDIVCGGDVEELHGPSTTGGGEPPEEQLRIELAQLDGQSGGSLSALFGLGECGQQAVEVSLGLQGISGSVETTTDVPLAGRASRELSLFPARAGAPPAAGGRLDLDLALVDVSYVRFLRSQTRRLVPEIALGVGWAFVDAEGPEPGRGLGDDSLTLNAAFRLRFNLDRYGGKYLYFGARSRWFEAREEDEVETQGVIGLGFGLPSSYR